MSAGVASTSSSTSGPTDRPTSADRRDREYVADGVTLTDGGQVVLAGGEAVLDVDDTVLVGTAVPRDPSR